MSTAKGNCARSRPQKHKNRTSFRNNLHDTSHRTKFINSIEVYNVCQRCKEIIEWKIKYKKYKPLSQPSKCVKCEQKKVTFAYHVMCTDCGKKLKQCTKCCKAKETIPASINKQEQLQFDADIQQLLQILPERKRRTFIRYMNKQVSGDTSIQKDDLLAKLNSLKVSDSDGDDNDDTDNLDFDEDDEEGSSE